MTAEVAILNRSAVVLAADSAVTIQSRDGEKTYNSVNKLFTLSKYFPIGIMINGNSDFMDYPWETLIKIFRHEIKQTEFRTVGEASDSFIKFLETKLSFTPEQQEVHLAQILNAYFKGFLGHVRRKLNAEVTARRKHLERAEVEALFDQVILERVTARRELETLPSMASLDAKKFQKQHKKLINDIVDGVFSGRPLSAVGKKRLREYAALVIVKSGMSALSSGVVIAGFGGEELFPRLVHVATDGIVSGIHRIRRDDHVVIAPDHPVYIQAFAQREMVMRFMEGVDPIYQQYLDTGIPEVLSDIVDGVVSQLVPDGPDRTKALAAAHRVAAKPLIEFLARADEYRYDYFSSPIVQTVAMLPKEELGNLAESLVNLTSVKRRMSMDAETVGGPIDVAIISKGDGFIWLRRKHYFRSELNPSFNRLYFRD